MTEYHCDFCFKPNPRWYFPAPTQIVGASDRPEGGFLLHNSVGGWAACTRCAGLAQRGQAKAIATAVLRERRYPAFLKAMLAEKLLELYRSVLPTLGERELFDTKKAGDPVSFLGSFEGHEG